MDFIASLLPIAIPAYMSIQTARLVFKPTSYVSFFGLCWLPYHDDLPYRLLRDFLVSGFINAVLSLLAPRYPRLLRAYSAGTLPKLPFNAQKLLPDYDWWIIASFAIFLFCGWLGAFMGMNLPYRFIVGLALYTLIAASTVYVLLHAVRVLWIYIRHYPERPPLGLVTGLPWPPLHQRAFGVAAVMLIIGIVMMGPTIGQYSTGVWSTPQTFRSWCQDERSADHTLTLKCRMFVDMSLPPPPALDQVFKYIGRPEAVAVVAPRTLPPSDWRLATDEERERVHAFIRGPVGNGISLAFFGFFVLMLPLEDQDLKWPQFACVLGIFRITRKASFVFALSNVCLLMNWARWLRKVGAKGPSWSSLAVLPVLYAVGYMHEKSTATQIIISIISALVAGDDYSHRVVPLFPILGRLGYGDQAKSSFSIQ